jgi:hypothetical protein
MTLFSSAIVAHSRGRGFVARISASAIREALAQAQVFPGLHPGYKSEVGWMAPSSIVLRCWWMDKASSTLRFLFGKFIARISASAIREICCPSRDFPGLHPGYGL